MAIYYYWHITSRHKCSRETYHRKSKTEREISGRTCFGIWTERTLSICYIGGVRRYRVEFKWPYLSIGGFKIHTKYLRLGQACYGGGAEKRNWVQSRLQTKCFVRRLRDLPHIKQTIFLGIISMDLQKDGNKTWQHFEFYGKKILRAPNSNRIGLCCQKSSA